MTWRFLYAGVLPFATAMVAVECNDVGLSTLFKAASLKGMSYYVYVFYSYAISTIILIIPLPFILSSSRQVLPPSRFPLFSRIFLLGLIGYDYVMLAFTADLNFNDLKSSISEKELRFFIFEESRALADIVGFEGIYYCSPTVDSAMSNLAQVMEIYPEEFIVVFFCYVCSTIILTPVCFIAESNWSSWRLYPDVTLAAVIYSGAFGYCLTSIVHTWALRVKGPVYVATFKPLSIAIAAIMSFIFLGDALYLGSVIGAVIISIGFYTVLWGKAKEEEMTQECDLVGGLPSSSDKTPLLRNPLIHSMTKDCIMQNGYPLGALVCLLFL